MFDDRVWDALDKMARRTNTTVTQLLETAVLETYHLKLEKEGT
jgi:predicted DNA-binding ribbon-helix-helix protein